MHTHIDTYAQKRCMNADTCRAVTHAYAKMHTHYGQCILCTHIECILGTEKSVDVKYYINGKYTRGMCVTVSLDVFGTEVPRSMPEMRLRVIDEIC